MATTAASDWVDDRPDEPELFADAELIIYAADIEDTEFDASEAVGDTDLAGLSLWARFEKRGVEIPLFSAYPAGGWLSLSVNVSGDVDYTEPVSGAFIDFNAYPWDVRESDWDAMTDAEKVISNSLRWSVIDASLIPEQAGVIEWCRARTDRDEPDS